ncbi:MAG TPA: YicC family protein [Deltaproteobacteria bacterium]|nr:YicC family protein [Deltaproteobacteria bacterium]
MKSMTGYGRGEFTLEDGATYRVEARSLNHRYIDVNIRMPDRFLPLEMRIRETIKNRFKRGSFAVYINSTSAGQAPIGVNLDVARRYLECAEELKEKLGVKGDATVEVLFRIRDIFSQKEEVDVEKDWQAMEEALLEALDGIEEMRRREGEFLKKGIEEGLSSIERLANSIEELAPESVRSFRERIREEIERLVSEKVDEARIATEVAIYSERVNINEEITRLKSHIKQMRGYLELEEPIGRKLDFLCQELLREANTIASKSQDVEIVQKTVDIKGELEKIREQVQNIE